MNNQMNNQMNLPIVVPRHVDWDAVWAIDNGGVGATALAREILRRHQDAGCEYVRMYGKHHDWLKAIYKELGIRRLIGIDWNSIFKPFNMPTPTDPSEREQFMDQFKIEYHRFIRTYVYVRIFDWRPELIFIDQEYSAERLLRWGMPSAIRRIADKLVGPRVPILYYFGDMYFKIKEIPNPALYYLWQDSTMTPVEKLDDIIVNGMWGRPASVYNVQGGLPWLSPFINANKLSLGLIDGYDWWVKVCERLKELGAIGFSMCPGPCDEDIGLGPINDRMFTFMKLGVEVFS